MVFSFITFFYTTPPINFHDFHRFLIRIQIRILFKDCLIKYFFLYDDFTIAKKRHSKMSHFEKIQNVLCFLILFQTILILYP